MQNTYTAGVLGVSHKKSIFLSNNFPELEIYGLQRALECYLHSVLWGFMRLDMWQGGSLWIPGSQWDQHELSFTLYAVQIAQND